MGWWAEVTAAVLPDACVACDVVLGEGEVGFCAECADRCLPLPSVCCGACAEPGAFAGGRCARCLASAPPFTWVRAPFEHEGAVARAIHRFKYEDRADLARPLAALTAPCVPSDGVLVPIPLHARRFQSRRFDQAALLAVGLGRQTGLRVEVGWLARARHTARQVGLHELERVRNVSGAFSSCDEVEGQRLVLVDDVYTTGATAREAARVLLGHGAREVCVVAVARARRSSAGG